jgi:hypothetical protein
MFLDNLVSTTIKSLIEGCVISILALISTIGISTAIFIVLVP